MGRSAQTDARRAKQDLAGTRCTHGNAPDLSPVLPDAGNGCLSPKEIAYSKAVLLPGHDAPIPTTTDHSTIEVGRMLPPVARSLGAGRRQRGPRPRAASDASAGFHLRPSLPLQNCIVALFYKELKKVYK